MDPDMYTAAMRDRGDDLDRYSADQFALQVTPNGNTILHVAAQFGSSDCVPTILRKCPSLLRRANTDGDTPIHVALTRRWNFSTVGSLIDFAKSEEGGGEAAVKEMLRARNHDGDTPLHLAARYDNWVWSLKKLLTSQDQGLDHGPNKAGETPLYLYVDQGYDVDVLSQMLKTCTPPEYGGPGGRTALHAAVICRKGLSESSGRRYLDKFIDKLIEWRNDLIKEPDADGLTPLHYAADNGVVEVVQKLLDKDKSVAYVNANNDEGNTALHMATAKGHTKVMNELLSKCPDCWEMVNSKGRNILHISADSERDEATKYISEQPWARSLVNWKDHEGNTPMHVLAQKGNPNLFFLFVWRSDVDMVALNNEAMTPPDILLRKIGVRKYMLLEKKFAREWLQRNKIPSRWWLRQQTSLEGLEEKDEGGEGMMNNRAQNDWLLRKKFLRGLDEKDEGGKGMMNNRERKEQRKKVKQKAAEEMSKMAETHMIVATLISTITFAAGFTIPGGYHGEQGPNQGMAVLVREAAFKAFVVSNTIALICSTSSVFLYVSASLFNIKGREGEKRTHRYEIAFWLILIAMVAMMIAFSTGAYAVLAHSLGLAIATCVIACSSFIVYAFELIKHFAEESLSSSWVEFREDPFDFCRSCFCSRKTLSLPEEERE